MVFERKINMTARIVVFQIRNLTLNQNEFKVIVLIEEGFDIIIQLF